MSNITYPVNCPSCGAQNTEGAFCVNCGSPLSAPAAQPAAYQPTYAQAPAPAPVVATQTEPSPQQPVVIVNNIKNYSSKWDYTPIRPWGYFGLNLLFAIPLIGLIFLLIFALGGTKRINLRNYARSFFCGLVLVVIFVIILIIFWGSIVTMLGESVSYSWSLF